MSTKLKPPLFTEESLHALQDRQGKIFFAQREAFGWIKLDGTPISSYGYTDLGPILQAYNRLAQYRHAARIFLNQPLTALNNVAGLLREIEN